MTSDATPLSLLLKSKSNKSCEVKFLNAVCKIPDPPVQKLTTFPSSSSPPRKNFNPAPPHPAPTPSKKKLQTLPSAKSLKSLYYPIPFYSSKGQGQKPWCRVCLIVNNYILGCSGENQCFYLFCSTYSTPRYENDNISAAGTAVC